MVWAINNVLIVEVAIVYFIVSCDTLCEKPGF